MILPPAFALLQSNWRSGYSIFMDNADNNNLQDRVIRFIKSNILIVASFSLGLILLGIGVIQLFGTNQTKIKFEKAADLASQGEALQKIKVDIEGEVINAGVYELNSDARVQDALIAAGGLTSNANRKAINLAAKIADGQKIYVPAQDEAMPAGSVVSGSTTASNSIISINSGTQAELEGLPGIGPVTAGKIIDNRPYGSIEELLEKKVVGKATFEKIKDQVSL